MLILVDNQSLSLISCIKALNEQSENKIVLCEQTCKSRNNSQCERRKEEDKLALKPVADLGISSCFHIRSRSSNSISNSPSQPGAKNFLKGDKKAILIAKKETKLKRPYHSERRKRNAKASIFPHLQFFIII